MATTTPNFGWTVPTSTDLVKDGATAIETLGDAIDASLGGAWTSWTPSFTNWALGNGTIDAKYKAIGKIVFLRIKFVVGSTTTKSGQLQLSLPVTATAYYGVAAPIKCTYDDNGSDIYEYFSRISTTNLQATYQLWSVAGNNRAISATAPFTWATNDQMYFQGFYEAA
jgi:hypothetical protein